MNLMKNIVCPVSTEKMPENLPRITAFFVTSLFGLFLYTGFTPLIILLAFDFFVRGFNYTHLSPLCYISKALLPFTGKTHKMIDKAPKLFAARIGFMISAGILVLNLFELPILTDSLVVIIMAFSILEWSFNICVGCAMYSWFVLPFSKQA
jgi:hypothetical protein